MAPLNAVAVPPRSDGEDLLHFLVDRVPAVLWSTDRNLRFTASLGAGLAPLGLNRNQVIGMSLFEYFGTRDPAFPAIAKHFKALEGHKSFFEFQWNDRVFHSRVEPMEGPDGEITGVLGMAMDITERKRAETALQESESRWKAVVSQAPSLVMILDRDARIFYLNRPLRYLSIEGAMGHTTLELIHPVYHTVVEEAHRRVFETGGTEMFDVQTRIHAGRPVAWFRCRVGPLYRNGRIANLIVMATDITEQKRAEEALNNSLVRMRQLAARLESAREEERKRIALDIHDRLGQALTGLKLDLASLASRLSGDREGRRRLRCTSRSLDDTIQTVREISTELRPAILDSLGLKAAIEWQAREYQSRSKLRFRLDLSADDDTLNPDLSAALFRTFQEILTNVARHARARRVNVSLSSGPNRLTLTVADDGKGISQKALSDPSSLGLLGMRERALAFGGTVDFRGRRGRGTTVAVSVPRSLKTNRKKSP